MKEKIVLVGAGGHCKVLIESLDTDTYEIIGVLDNFVSKGTMINGVPVIGNDASAESLFQAGVHNAAIAIVGNLKIRRTLLDKYTKIGFSFPIIVHPTAHVSSSAQIGKGTAILAGATINAEAKVQDFATVNTGAIIEHEVLVGENSHVAPGAILLGASQVGADAMVGAGSIVLQQKKIGNSCTVGAGSIVLRNVADAKTVYGNPAQEKEMS